MTSCGDMRSTSATSTAGVTCATAPTATAYGTRCSTLVITERAGKHLTTHVLERTYNGNAERPLLRRATLKDWPPKYQAEAATEPSTPAEPAPWGKVDESELDEAAVPAAKKGRVRSLIRPLR